MKVRPPQQPLAGPAACMALDDAFGPAVVSEVNRMLPHACASAVSAASEKSHLEVRTKT